LICLPNQDASSLVMVKNSFLSLDALFSKAPITIVDVITCMPSSICNNHTPDIAQHYVTINGLSFKLLNYIYYYIVMHT